MRDLPANWNITTTIHWISFPQYPLFANQTSPTSLSSPCAVFFSPADSIGTGTVHTSWKMTCVTGLPLDLFQPPDPKPPGTLLSPPSPVSAPTKKLNPANNCGGISQLWITLQQPASERSACRPKYHYHLQLGFVPPRPILLPNPILLIIFPMASPSHPLQQTPQAQIKTNQFEE